MGQDFKPTGKSVAIIDSLGHEKMTGLVLEVAEIGLDKLLDEEMLKEIPIFGWIATLHGLGTSVRDRLFLHKIWKFLEGLSLTSSEEQIKFAEKLSEDAGSREKAGLLLTSHLDRLDEIEKASVLARICIARMRGAISYEEFSRYAMILDRCFLPDINALSKLPYCGTVDMAAVPLLNSLGVVYETGDHQGMLDSIGAEKWHEVSELGRKFLEAAFFEDVP